jgi:hypothetical protein
MRLIRALLPLLILAIPVPMSASHPLATKALDALDSFERDDWSYTMTTTSKDGTRVERHDATRPEGQRWTLVKVDGRAPKPGEIEDYLEEKEKLRKASKENDDEHDVDRSSIRLISETPQRATFTFRTKSDGGIGAKMVEKIVGTLVVNKDGGWAERFELQNEGDLAPIPGVKVTRFRLSLNFHRDQSSREIVLGTIEMSTRGRAFLVKSLDDDRVTRFSDFVRVR